jgi:hypothetical protein
MPFKSRQSLAKAALKLPFRALQAKYPNQLSGPANPSLAAPILAPQASPIGLLSTGLRRRKRPQRFSSV